MNLDPYPLAPVGAQPGMTERDRRREGALRRAHMAARTLMLSRGIKAPANGTFGSIKKSD